MFNKLFSVFLTGVVFVGCCASGKQSAVGEVSLQPAESLHACFIKADSLERADRWDREAWGSLKISLHRQLRERGDAVFSQALAQESYEVQRSVVNCMGLNPSDYDEYPRTQYVLSAAPKN